MVESSNDAALQQVFKDYCGKESTMEGKAFAKCAKDTKLLDKKLTATDVDLTFAKVKDKTGRRITFAQFKAGLGHFATKKGVSVDDVIAKVAASKGPILAGTKAEANKFHDDKTLYTGVHAQGGPSTNDLGTSDLSQFANRGGADVRGISNATGAAQVTHAMGNVQIEESKAVPKAAAPKKAAAAAPVQAGAPASNLKEVFAKFTAGAKEMDGKTFAKVSKDCKIINKSCTATDIDLIFAKCKDKAARKITFAQFDSAIELCATKRGSTKDVLVESILSHGAPTFTGTQAQANKFHDDKSLYTGVHAKGGPSTNDLGTSDLSQIANRGAANVRGTNL